MPSPPDIDRARSFLEQRYGSAVGGVEWAGEGAWSRCFGYEQEGRELVVRFGRHRSDFEKDQRASGFRGPGLPVPELLELGRAFGAHFAVSTRGRGEPLETLSSEAWRAALPSVLGMLDAARNLDLSTTSGWGRWGAEGHGEEPSWREFLLAVEKDDPESRTHGWRERLAASPDGDAAFRSGHARLMEIAVDLPVERHLVHADLINRNVLVAGDRVSAIFDWGCSLYGDFLYDLAWLEFWSPWHPGLTAVGVRAAARRHYDAIGLDVPDFERRMLVCAAHIGLDHLAYNAHTGNRAALTAVVERLAPMLDAPVQGT